MGRLHQHLPDPKPLILVVSSKNFPAAFWNRVRRLVAFRIHRARAEGGTVPDAAIYLVRDSDLYLKAAKAVRINSTHQEYVWCQLAAVVAHESAHTEPDTELRALTAEAEQLRICLRAGHLHSGDGWDPIAYLGAVESKMRNPRQHY